MTAPGNFGRRALSRPVMHDGSVGRAGQSIGGGYGVLVRSGPPPRTRDDDPAPVLGAAAKFAVTAAWFLLASVPSLLLFLFNIRLTAGSGIAPPDFFVLPFFWCVSVGLTAPLYVRMLGHTGEVRASPPPPQLHHLPPACARLVAAAAAIRQDLGDVEAALQRAWELANEVEQAPPDVRLVLDGAGATLQPVRGLIATHAEARRPRKLRASLRASLGAALAEFEAALTRPRSGGFR